MSDPSYVSSISFTHTNASTVSICTINTQSIRTIIYDKQDIHTNFKTILPVRVLRRSHVEVTKICMIFDTNTEPTKLNITGRLVRQPERKKYAPAYNMTIRENMRKTDNVVKFPSYLLNIYKHSWKRSNHSFDPIQWNKDMQHMLDIQQRVQHIHA